MSLTSENMKTRPHTRNYDAMDQDIASMDSEQLNRYIRLAFTGGQDLGFLPEQFWDNFNILGGDGGDGAPNPGIYFSDVFVRMGKGIEEGRDSTGCRQRLRKIFIDILDESIRLKGQPTETQMMLTKFTIEAVGNIRFSDGPNSPELQFIQKSVEEGGSIPVSRGREIAKSLEYPNIDKNEMFRRVRELKNDPRYKSLEFPFF